MELEDIQGLVARGHSDMPEACYLHLKINSAEKARNWLKKVLPEITPANQKPENRRLQIAFTFPGLLAMGLPENELENFNPEFVQGMATAYRARLLGDIGNSAAEQWEWGGPENPAVHILLCLFAKNPIELKTWTKALSAEFELAELTVSKRLDSQLNPAGKEHFGFHDGVSQPILPGLGKKGSPGNPEVPIGEFVLGYPNAYNELPDSPRLPKAHDVGEYLTQDAGKADFVDFGKNGTYLVFRQLRQDVANFWRFLKEAVQKENPAAGVEDTIFLASKMVGRWPSGAPLACAQRKDAPELADENDFLYHEKDAEGFACPVGAHVRRANPRDALQNNKPEKAMRISSRHRILRRGRNFGPPLSASFLPQDMMAVEDDGIQRGLHFICLNTNIARQFEFVQHTWSDNTKFEGLYDDPDPLLGIKDSRNKSLTHDFTIPQKPIRRKIQGLQRHVHVLGGAYFFLPGMRTLTFLAHFSPKI